MMLRRVVCVSALLALPLSVLAQDARIPAKTPEVQQALAHAKGLSAAFNYGARRISPSVVHITQLANVRFQRSWFDPPESMLRQIGAGSGVVMSADGYILTNHHVLAGAEKVRVKFADGREVDGKIVGSDPATDLGVVKVDESGLVAAEWGDSESLDIGEWVLAVGSPFGQFDNTVTAGIVSAKNRTNLTALSQESYQDFIQTDAAINPGNSGGPLVDLEGRVVGINSQIATRGVAQSAGIGFSIPETIAKPVMESIIKTGRTQRGWAGVGPKSDSSGQEVRASGGVVVGEIVRGGPADKAGIRPGDVIQRINGRSVENWNRVRNAIVFSTPGTPAEFEILRGGSPKTLTVNVADRLEGLTLTEGGKAFKPFGFTVATLSREMKQQLNLRQDLEGVIVTQIDPMGPAQGRLEPEDIIVRLNGTPTPDARSFDNAVEDANRGVRLDVIRLKANDRGWVELQRRGRESDR